MVLLRLMSFMLLISASLERCIAFRCFNSGCRRLISTSNRHVCFYIKESKGKRCYLPDSMRIATSDSNEFGSDISVSNSRSKMQITEDETDENEEIPLSEEEKIEALNRIDDEDDDEDDGEDDDDEDKSNKANKIIKEGSLRLKVRQHVNPLSSRYLVPMEGGDEWVTNNYFNPTLPAIVDIGCAKGTWVLKSGLANPDKNILGLEIRRPVVEFALERKFKWGLNNVHFLSVNVNVDLERILFDLKTKGGSIDMVTIQFPDPHFKKKHKKRRVVNEKLVNTIVSYLDVGKKVFLQSDILDVTEDMVLNFANNSELKIVEGFDIEKLDINLSPNKVLTEREIATQKKGLPIYRMMFEKI